MAFSVRNREISVIRVLKKQSLRLDKEKNDFKQIAIQKFGGEGLTALFGLLAQGKIKPVIEKRMKLEEATQAHRLIEQAKVQGRLTLTIN